MAKLEPLTDEEKEIFSHLRTDPNVALLQGSFRGERRSFVCFSYKDGDNYYLSPVAMLLTPNDLLLCQDSDGKETESMVDKQDTVVPFTGVSERGSTQLPMVEG